MRREVIKTYKCINNYPNGPTKESILYVYSDRTFELMEFSTGEIKPHPYFNVKDFRMFWELSEDRGLSQLLQGQLIWVRSHENDAWKMRYFSKVIDGHRCHTYRLEPGCDLKDLVKSDFNEYWKIWSSLPPQSIILSQI